MPALPAVILGAEAVFAGSGAAAPAVIDGALLTFQDVSGNPVVVSAANPLPVTLASAGSPTAGRYVPVAAAMPLPTT